MVGLTGYGLYVPEDTVTGEEIARKIEIPEDVVVEKMGIREKHVCPRDGDHVTDMCVKAAERALSHAGIENGLIEPGDVVYFLAAGTGYTCGATVLDWHGE